MAGVEKKLKVWTFKGISMHFPSIPRCFGISFFFSYTMTSRKASDVTHSVEEIPQGIHWHHPSKSSPVQSPLGEMNIFRIPPVIPTTELSLHEGATCFTTRKTKKNSPSNWNNSPPFRNIDLYNVSGSSDQWSLSFLAHRTSFQGGVFFLPAKKKTPHLFHHDLPRMLRTVSDIETSRS